METGISAVNLDVPNETVPDKTEGAGTGLEDAVIKGARGLFSVVPPSLNRPEVARLPLPHEPQVIAPDRVAVVVRLSKIEYQQRKQGLSEIEVLKQFQARGDNLEALLESHAKQLESKRMAASLLTPEQVFARDDVSKIDPSAYDLVIALGGDNHFQFVSHFIGDGFILGVNADPGSSDGALTYYSPFELKRVLAKLAKGEFLVEEWSRLEATLNGERKALALGEYFLGERERSQMSRHEIIFPDGSSEQQKGSGLVIATGSGSTGWYDSACRYLHPEGNLFPRTAAEARFILTEPFRGKYSRYGRLSGAIQKGEKLAIKSLNDSSGLLACDSLEEYEFNRGAVVEIGISNQPLKVLRVD